MPTKMDCLYGYELDGTENQGDGCTLDRINPQIRNGAHHGYCPLEWDHLPDTCPHFVQCFYSVKIEEVFTEKRYRLECLKCHRTYEITEEPEFCSYCGNRFIFPHKEQRNNSYFTQEKPTVLFIDDTRNGIIAECTECHYNFEKTNEVNYCPKCGVKLIFPKNVDW